ncbi:hypothetical protein K1719_035160 [Acacia pycnantha]|nr:hypothetical protein K1719_035160 [Acacia pycnantha]
MTLDSWETRPLEHSNDYIGCHWAWAECPMAEKILGLYARLYQSNDISQAFQSSEILQAFQNGLQIELRHPQDVIFQPLTVLSISEFDENRLTPCSYELSNGTRIIEIGHDQVYFFLSSPTLRLKQRMLAEVNLTFLNVASLFHWLRRIGCCPKRIAQFWSAEMQFCC